MTTPAPSVSDRLLTWAQQHPITVPPDQRTVREEFVRTFPLERLPTLTLDEYVMGRGDQDNYCYWLERRTDKLGSIFGGAANKFGVYWSEKNQDYRHTAMFSSPQDAAKRILNGIVHGSQALAVDDIAGTDQATSEAMGYTRYTMRLKALTLYFPEKLLPIVNPEHLKHFLRALGLDPSGDQAALNVQLLQALQVLPGAQGYDTQGLMRFLYGVFPPPAYDEGNRRVWKVALGENAAYLQEALDHGVIMIGSAVQDLGEHGASSMANALTAVSQSAGFKDTAFAFAHRMKEGDVVVANRGMTEVVALGVIDGPYLAPEEEGNPLRPAVLGDRYPYWAHARRVRWLVQSPLGLPAGLRKLAISTITTLPESTLTTILAAYVGQATDPATLTALKELGWKEKVVVVKPPISEEVKELLEIAEWTRNIILYGPPGTGKTYTARRFADAFLEQQLQAPAGSVSGPMSSGGTPRFWWQAVAFALAELGSASVPDIEAHPVITAFRSARNNAHVQQTIWQQLLTHTDPADSSSNTASRIPPYVFTKSQTDAWQLTAAGEAVVATLQDHPAPDAVQNATDPFLFPVTFHPAFTYEDFVEGLRPARDGPGLTVRDGIFKHICAAAREDPDNRYVLLIDEINRADTAKTFGELITLIEDDKRAVAGQPARYEVNLPYSDPSDNRFSVPDNVYIIGTMNTADRSVALMDVALRRRFTFVEVPPAIAHLESLDGLSLGGLLSSLNARLTQLLDRDHAIGHAYLTLDKEALNVKVLRYRWRYKIVPLLQEYFYADQEGLQKVLGKTLYQDANGIKKLSESEFMQALKALEAEK